MSQTFRFQVERDEAGRRLDEFLAARLGSLSRMRIGVLAERGACAVNGVARPGGHKVAAGDAVEVADDESKPTAMTPERLPLDILFEDDQLLVVVKPAGMLVHPTHSDMTGTLANALAYHLNRFWISDFGFWIEGEPALSPEGDDVRGEADPKSKIGNPKWIRPGIVHRIDRATSGLLVIAKTQRALSVLSTHFQRRLVEKRYVALVRGRVAEDELRISAPIGRDPASRPEWNVREGGKPSETRLRVLERAGERTLVELEPVTGRTNQLRIHCAHAGHPIVGDEWYGAGAADGAGRLCLHAARLAFFHPSGGNRWMEFTSPAPFAEVSGEQ
jgi:23S rRNA pseudouridine1911/1915/1917 synthase